jgi:hypothetical protein
MSVEHIRMEYRRCDGPQRHSPTNPPMNILARAAILAAIILSGLPATAQQPATPTNHAMHGAPMSRAEIDATPSSKAF